MGLGIKTSKLMVCKIFYFVYFQTKTYKKLNKWLAEGDFSGFGKKLTEIRALLRPKDAPQLSARLFSPNLLILCDLDKIFPERDFGAKKSV